MPLNDDRLNPDYDITSSQKIDLLPIRGEKRLLLVAGEAGGIPEVKGQRFEALTFAKRTLTDYVTVRIPGRLTARNNDKPTDFVFRFLINPKSVSIAHQTFDTHSMTRGGWQFGVWGEDTIDLNITGITAGQYFNFGLSDRWSEYSISYRNLMELANLFENNGYYFEGEPTIPSVFDGDYTRRRIKMHQDVELRIGNFIWKGMFTNMNIEETADTPYLDKFTIGFLAWKESYSSSSPWISPKDINKYRGHAQEVLKNDLVINKSIPPVNIPTANIKGVDPKLPPQPTGQPTKKGAI